MQSEPGRCGRDSAAQSAWARKPEAIPSEKPSSKAAEHEDYIDSPAQAKQYGSTKRQDTTRSPDNLFHCSRVALGKAAQEPP